ncbi:MAG: hypothetical protein QXX20_04830 [Candidatus Thermoplasmatota archaeon]
MEATESFLESTSGIPNQGIPGEEGKKFIELQKISVIETILTTALAAIVVASLFYLTNADLYSTIAQFWFYFAFLIVPGGCFLLVVHAYTLFETYTAKKRIIPFVLDTTYFLYLIPSFLTIFILGILYTQYGISYKLFAPGWFVAVALLFVELAIVFELSRNITVSFFRSRFSHLFPSVQQKKVQSIPQYKIDRFQKPKRNMVFYLRKKPETSRWSDDDSFVRYQHL